MAEDTNRSENTLNILYRVIFWLGTAHILSTMACWSNNLLGLIQDVPVSPLSTAAEFVIGIFMFVGFIVLGIFFVFVCAANICYILPCLNGFLSLIYIIHSIRNKKITWKKFGVLLIINVLSWLALINAKDVFDMMMSV